MSEWKTIITQDDIIEIMDVCGNFHDSCIVSANFQSNAFVDDKMSMHFGNAEKSRLSVIIHSQWEPRVVELCFVGLRQCHLIGWQDNYFCDIFDAYMSFHDDVLSGKSARVIVWSDNACFDLSNIDNTIHEPSDTYIIANTLKWRIVE